MPVLTDARVEFNSTDYSSQVRSVTLNYSAEEVDDTAMGDSTRSAEGGLKNVSASVEFYADETSGGNTVDLFSAIGGTAQTLAIRPTSSAISGTNPEYQFSAIPMSMEPVAGSVGDSQINSVSFVAAGDLSRATS